MKNGKRRLLLFAAAALALLFAGNAFASGSLLRWGSRGEAVKQMQGNLIYLGYLNDRADGIFGAKTDAAVRQYQRTNGLAADGIIGSKTRRAIVKEVLLLNTVRDSAEACLGIPYKTAGTSPETGFDCSGFTRYVFSEAGISIPRVSRDQAKAGIPVPVSKMRPGDLVCFNSPVSHVGIYLGGGKFIHAPKPGDKVKITDLRYMDLTAVRRFTGAV